MAYVMFIVFILGISTGVTATMWRDGRDVPCTKPVTILAVIAALVLIGISAWVEHIMGGTP